LHENRKKKKSLPESLFYLVIELLIVM